MVALLASMMGFFSSIFPDILKIFRDKADKKHELEILKHQIKYNDANHNNKLEEISVLADMYEAKTIYKTYNTGIGWIDALNGAVRPIIAFSFFFIYGFVKYLEYCILIKSGITEDLVAILWKEDDQAIFAGIISFYYGQRALKKLNR